MADRIIWRTSGWDHQVHAFPALGEIASEATCTHTAQTSNLGEPGTGDRVCPACARRHPAELRQLVTSFGAHERDRWAT